MALLLAGSATIAIPSGAAPTCPDARTCELFQLYDGAKDWWSPGRDGVVDLRYMIRLPMAPNVDLDDFRGAIALASRTWEASGVKLRLRDVGVLGPTELPPLDVQGTFEFSALAQHNAAVATSVLRPDTNDIGNDPLNRSVRQFIVAFNPAAVRWTWHPCGLRGGPCTDIPGQALELDLQSVATHEIGHVLGLDHVDTSAAVELTMYPRVQAEANHIGRRTSTLARGDVLGLRALYGSRDRRTLISRP